MQSVRQINPYKSNTSTPPGGVERRGWGRGWGFSESKELCGQQLQPRLGGVNSKFRQPSSNHAAAYVVGGGVEEGQPRRSYSERHRV